MTEDSPVRFIPGDVSPDYEFKYASGNYEEQPISPDLLPRQVQRVAQDISDLEREIERVNKDKEAILQQSQERKSELERHLTALRVLTAEFSTAS
jgi:t-SNARE complex subunit (syntaxin)